LTHCERRRESRKAAGDPREVVRDPEVRYFGGRVEERSQRELPNVPGVKVASENLNPRLL
jgi:hypothetical protein